MARGSRIIVSSATGLGGGMNVKAGVLGDSSIPGTIMQVKGNTVNTANGQFTWIAAAPGTTGFNVLNAVLCGDVWDGLLSTVTPGIGTTIFMYCALPGDEVNVLVGVLSGTTNYILVGERLESFAVGGVLVPVTGTNAASWLALEVVSGVALDNLTWCLKL